MLFILIYIFFIFSSSFRFFICDYVIPVSPVTPSLNSSSEKGLKFELWLRDSQFNFHLKIAMLFILIYIFFIFSSFFRFYICDYVIPVSPMTPSLNSSPEKRSDIWAVIAWFPLQFPPENCYVIYFDLYLLYIFFFFRFYICDYVIPVSPVTPSLDSILFFIFSSFLDFSPVTTWSPCPPWLPV